jgi:hypothetical protein
VQEALSEMIGPDRFWQAESEQEIAAGALESALDS